MALTDEDLKKIKTIVDARADLQDSKFERRFSDVEQRFSTEIDGIKSVMATRLDIVALKESLASKQQVEEIKDMLTEDINAFGGDVATLKRRATAKPRR